MEQVDEIVITRCKEGWEAKWDNVSGKGKSPKEAIDALAYLIAFMNGSL